MPDRVAERHRSRITTLLTADAHFEGRALLAAALDADAHQLADAFLVDRLERIVRQDLLLQVLAQEFALGVIARVANVVWVRSLVPYEKNSAVSAIWPATMHARGTSMHAPNL